MKTNCMVMKKNDSPMFWLRIGDFRVERVRKFNYLDRGKTDDGKRDKGTHG